MPGHIDVEGNKKADEAAKETAKKAGIGRCPKTFASLARVQRKLSERNQKEAKHWLRTENDRHPPLQRAQYDPAIVIQGPDVAAMEKAAHVSR